MGAPGLLLHNHSNAVVEIQVGAGQGHIVQCPARPGGIVIRVHVKMGDVIDIGILRTTLMELGEWVKADLYTGRIVRIANSFVFKEPVFNYSGDFPFLWDEITVPVTYASDHRLAREILEKIIHRVIEEYSAFAKRAWKDIVKKYMVEEAMIDPAVTLVCTDNWIEFTVRYITDFKLRRSTKNRLFSLILDEFEKTGGRVKIASTTMQLVDPQPLTVKFSGKLPE